jgi:hypothetical protein
MRLRKQKKVGKYKENPGIEIQEQGFRVNEHRFEGREQEAFVQDFECSKEKTPSTYSASQLLSLSLSLSFSQFLQTKYHEEMSSYFPPCPTLRPTPNDNAHPFFFFFFNNCKEIKLTRAEQL